MGFRVPPVPMIIVCASNDENNITNIENCLSSMGEARHLIEKIIFSPSFVDTKREIRESIINDCQPGLIFIDTQMPDALDLLHDLRSNNDLMTIPIVMLTDSLEETDLTCTMAHGVTGYFLKPVEAVQLRKVIRDIEEHFALLATQLCAN